MVIPMVVLAAVAAFLAGLLGAAEVGRRVGTRDLARDPEGLARGTGAAEAAVFALLGLLLAFTFAGAASRFEARRHLVTEEANAIGTAYLRLDLLPAGERADLQALFRRYVDGRLDSYRHGHDLAAAAVSLGQDAALQGEIWRRAVAASTAPGMPSQAAMLLLPALNAMIDITTTRWTATRNHPPVVVFAMLGVVALVGSLLVGYATSVNRRRSTLHTALFAIILTVTTYVIFDLEFPRLGMIRVTSADQVLVDLRTSMR